MLKASVIIPSYDRQMITLETLSHLNDQTETKFEVIVVDQTEKKSKDLELFQFRNSSMGYKYVRIKEIGLPNARNVGVNYANTNLVIFIDDDCIPHKSLIESYCKIFNTQESNIWCIGGRVIEKDSAIFKQSNKIVGGSITWYGKTLKNFDSSKSGYSQWVPGGNFAVKKDKFKEVGGFDTNYIGNAMLEDSDFSFMISRFGGKLVYNPEPVIEHLRIPTGGTRKESASKGMLYRAHNTIYFLRKHRMKPRIFPATVYLLGVVIKDLLNKKHGPSSIIWMILGLIKGIKTRKI